MDIITNTTGAQTPGTGRKIMLIFSALAILAIGIYYFMNRNNDVAKAMERARQAKADKKILTNVQNDN
jgi:uncharacterized protein HemX